jgi:uncharacterized protein (TIRG00374 family)
MNAARRQFRWRPILVGLVSVLILVFLYRRVNVEALRQVFARFDFFYFVLILLSFVVIYLLVAWRWQLMARPHGPIGFWESVKLVAASGALNILLPSRMGSFTKAYFMVTRGHTNAKMGLSMVIYEKFSDLAALGLLFVLATVVSSPRNPLIVSGLGAAGFVLLCFALLHLTNVFEFSPIRRLRQNRWIDRLVGLAETLYVFNHDPAVHRALLVKVNLISLLLWVVHVIQIVLFFYLIDLSLPVWRIASNMLCAVLVGLLPISLAGLGTRDLAIVYLFEGLLSYSESLSIGILMASRYVIPTLLGLPFFIGLMSADERRDLVRGSAQMCQSVQGG